MLHLNIDIGANDVHFHFNPRGGACSGIPPNQWIVYFSSQEVFLSSAM